MKIPEMVTVQIQCDVPADLSDIIIELEVISGRKNPYSIFFPKTDTLGKAVLSHSDFKGQFTDHSEMGLMDYAGNPDNIKPKVKVILFNPKPMIQNGFHTLSWPLFSHERTKWVSRQEMYDYMTTCRNEFFHMDHQTIDLKKTGNFAIKVTAVSG